MPSVQVIGRYAFRGCSGLTSVTISNGVTNIGDRAFINCGNLAEVVFLGNAPTSVGTNAFANVASGAKAIVR